VPSQGERIDVSKSGSGRVNVDSADRVVVRVLRPDDWRTIRDLRLAALSDAADELGAGPDSARPGNERYWRGWPLRGVPLAGFVGGRPVGLVGIVTAPADPVTARLVALWVAPVARGAGVGDALVEAVVAVARQWGCRSVTLEVLTTNQPAVSLYRRHGFALSSEPPFAPGAIAMRRMVALGAAEMNGPSGPLADG
jgi:ribosomal protein S18 acetylase RimI-like enzyme